MNQTDVKLLATVMAEADDDPEFSRGSGDGEPSKYVGFRNLAAFLDAYKPIFEVGAATLLGVMAIVISITQTCSTQRQTELLAVQTQILEAQAVPQFTARRVVSENGDTITVENRGGLLRTAEIDVFELLYVEVVRPHGRERGWFAIRGYFDDVGRGADWSAASFSLSVAASKRNSLKKLARDLETYRYKVTTFYKQDSMKFRVLGAVSFIRIRRSDLLNRKQDVWFMTVDGLTASGDRIVVPEDYAVVKKALKDWHYADAVAIQTRVTPELVCRIARAILKNAA